MDMGEEGGVVSGGMVATGIVAVDLFEKLWAGGFGSEGVVSSVGVGVGFGRWVRRV